MSGNNEIAPAAQNDHWPNNSEQVRRDLVIAVSRAIGFIFSIGRAGSAAVQRLAAKPILDSDVVISISDVAEELFRLKRVDNARRGDPGVFFRQSVRALDDCVARHTYVVAESSVAWQNRRSCATSSDVPPAVRYEQLRRELFAHDLKSMDDDVNGKSEFLLEVLEEAGRDALGLAEMAKIHGLIDPSVTAVASLAPRNLNSTW